MGGSIPERCDGRLYNTCFVYGRDGRLLGRHRKVGFQGEVGLGGTVLGWVPAGLPQEGMRLLAALPPKPAWPQPLTCARILLHMSPGAPV